VRGPFYLPGVLGTAIFKVFDFHVAKTGLGMKEAARKALNPSRPLSGATAKPTFCREERNRY